MSKNIKFRVYFTPEQYSIFSNALFACQMFRNHCLNVLKNRSFAKRTWLKSNANTPEYLAYCAENIKYLALLKEFKEQYPTKELQKANKDKQPVKPERFHPLLESNYVALNLELTAQLDKARVWLLKNLPNFKSHLDKHEIVIPAKSPQNICVFYNSLPLSVRKALGKSARNENVLLYLLGSPRSCLVQVVQDLDKTFTKAFKEREQLLKNNSKTKPGKSINTSGFPNFKTLQRHGGIRNLTTGTHVLLPPGTTNRLSPPSLGNCTGTMVATFYPKHRPKCSPSKKRKTVKFLLCFMELQSTTPNARNSTCVLLHEKPLLHLVQALKSFLTPTVCPLI